MTNYVYWLMGERAGRVLLASWNWLWGKPVQAGGFIAVEVASESFRAMEKSVLQLTEAVANLVAICERVKKKYEIKVQEFHLFEKEATLAQRQGNLEAAQKAMNKAILIERFLPQLQQQVVQAEKMVVAAKEKLHREREKLENFKIELLNLKDLSIVNEALAEIVKTNLDITIDSAGNQFVEAQAAIEQRYLKIQALAELSENSTEKLETDLNKITLNDEVTYRLKLLADFNASESYEQNHS